jgi:hypothetical protein
VLRGVEGESKFSHLVGPTCLHDTGCNGVQIF